MTLREAPSDDAAVLKSLSPEPHVLEVVAQSEDGSWGQVHVGQSPGWIALTDVQRLEGAAAEGLPLSCFGVEPFWSLAVPSAFFASYARPEHDDVPLQMSGMDEAMGPGGRTRLWSFAGDGLRATLLVRNDQCSDGMSDRVFGLTAALSMQRAAGAVDLRLGCCALTVP